MKRLIIILIVAVTGSCVQAQQSKNLEKDLIQAVVGTWKVVKYQSEKEKYSKADTLMFTHDGIFQSDSIYFASKTGLYRTDENRGVLILEIAGQITEWVTTVKKGVLRMRSARENKGPTIYITSVRLKEG